MTGLDYAAFVVLAILIGMGVGVFIFLGGWPGRVARKNKHPYGQAIQVGGWITLVAGGVFWPLVLMWAYAPPGGPKRSDKEQAARASDESKGD